MIAPIPLLRAFHHESMGFAMDDHDKSNQQLVEELAELRQRETKWRSVVNNAPVFMAIVDRDGRMTFLNRYRPGYGQKEVIGKHFCEFVQPEYRTIARKCLASVFETGEPTSYESLGAGANGSITWYETQVGPIKVGDEIVAAAFVSIDTTERKRAEKALQESQRRLSTLMSNLPGMAYRCKNDSRWTMEFISDGSILLTGYTPWALIANREVAYGDIIVAADRDRVWTEVQQAIAENRHFQLEYRIRTASGEEKWVWEQGIAVYSDSDQVEALEGMISDITERKRSEKALQKAHDELERRVEERTSELLNANKELNILRLFAQSASQSFGIADLDGIVKYVNPAMCRLLGQQRAEDVVGGYFFKFGRSLEFLRDEFLPTLLREGRWDREGTVHHADGTFTPVWHSSVVVRNDEGQPAYIATILSDITERKQAEEKLRQSEHRFRNYYEQGLIGMAATAADGRWLDINDRICQILGYSKEELYAKTWAELTHPEDLNEDLEQLRLLLNGEIEKYNLDKRFIRKDGSVVYTTIHIRAFRKEDQSLDHIVGLMEDITERVQAQEALRHAHDELRAIYEGMVDGLHILNLETLRPLRANPALCRMMGYSEKEILTLSPADVHPPEALPRIKQEFQDYLDGRKSVATDVPLVRKDGSVFYADVTGSRIVYNGVPCVICFFHDITDRQIAQESLQREGRTLKHLLQSSDHERQLIAYDIHDGLAQQLAAAIMQFDAYDHLKDTKPKQAADAYHAAITMLRQGHFETRRLIAGVRPPILDEAGVVEAISHLVHEVGREKGPKIEYVSRIDFDRLVPILENAIFRICQEAVTNACKHSKSEKVRVSLVQQKERVRITIQDWGIGFDAKRVRDNRFGIEGIRQRARLLGGKCSIRSAPDAGTRILVELPVVEREKDQ
jgi:PAS domain S-box-containing protein